MVVYHPETPIYKGGPTNLLNKQRILQWNILHCKYDTWLLFKIFCLTYCTKYPDTLNILVFFNEGDLGDKLQDVEWIVSPPNNSSLQKILLVGYRLKVCLCQVNFWCMLRVLQIVPRCFYVLLSIKSLLWSWNNTKRVGWSQLKSIKGTSKFKITIFKDL